MEEETDELNEKIKAQINTLEDKLKVIKERKREKKTPRENYTTP